MLLGKGNLKKSVILLLTGAALLMVPHVRAQSTATISGMSQIKREGWFPELL